MQEQALGFEVAGRSSGGARPFSDVLARNITALLDLRNAAEERKSGQDRIADAITRFTGSLTFVYIHAVLFGIWILWNTGILGLPPFDPSLVVLAMAASVEAIFLSTFVLISQNRMAAAAEKRAELDLQISLLAEHEVTQMIRMLDAVAAHLGVHHGEDASLNDSKNDVDPTAVMEVIEETVDQADAEAAKDRVVDRVRRG